MSEAHVLLKNPETGGVWDCPIDYAPIATARGWEPHEEPAVEEEPEVPASPVSKNAKKKTAGSD